MTRRLSVSETCRDFTRLELRQAEEIADRVRRYLAGHPVDEVAARIGMPKSLVRKLAGDDIGKLVDVIQWRRRVVGAGFGN